MGYVCDTNIFLSRINLEEYFDEKIIIPVVVLEELDNRNHNENKQISYDARKALKKIYDLVDSDRAEYLCNSENLQKIMEGFTWADINKNDTKILAYAKAEYIKNNEIKLLTMDRNMAAKAMAMELPCKFISKNTSNIYKGYIEVTGDTDFINNFYENINEEQLFLNEYVVFKDTFLNKEWEAKWDGKDLVPLKIPSDFDAKAKNALQRCAIDLLNNKKITTAVVLGGYGSGKTFLCFQSAMYSVLTKKNQKKIVGVREPVGEGKDVGFLKGTFEDKTGMFFAPLKQQLPYDGYQYLSDTKQLESQIPFYMKGTTYDDSILVVDEAEDLTESQIRLIGTRIGKNSKIFFSGDFNQSIKDKTTNNPLVKMCDELKGNPIFGCIYLDEDVRSETSKLFANLFK